MSQSIHNSFWLRETPLRSRFDKLESSIETDVLIIGAGISGLSAAIEIASRGREVVVCESGVIGGGTTGASTGHLDAHPEMGADNLISKLGLDIARDYLNARRAAIKRIASIAGNDCDLKFLPAYQYTELDDEKSLRKDFVALEKLGFDVEWSETVPISKAKHGYMIREMARIDSRKYLDKLTEVALETGVKIYENTLVYGTTEKNPAYLRAGNTQVRFKDVVCATHSNYTASLHIYAATPAYQSYVLVARVKELLEDALFWDDSEPYYYVRRAKSDDDRLLIIGGCDHRTGIGEEAQAQSKLEAWARGRFDIEDIVHQWSAELFEPTDGLPMVGKAFGDNMWVITGLSGVGLTLGTASGKWIADLLDGKSDPVLDAISPTRLGIGNALDWAKEQVTTAIDVAERVLPAKSIVAADLEVGQGVTGKEDGKFVAACRDRTGVLHCHSPICTHMGGVVHWNEVEKTWDCPVHGGRFKGDGERLYGPPEEPLESPE